MSVKIDVFSDYVCPYCLLIEGVLAEATQGLNVDIQWQPFELRATTGQWYRTHGNKHWEFDADGYMARRDMSANDNPITADDRRIGN